MTPATIRFSAKLEEDLLTLPRAASAKLPKGKATVEATINGFPFRETLEPDSKGRHRLKVSPIILDATGADVGDTVPLEITRVDDEPATRMPADLKAALAAAPRAQATWDAITANARQNWILWLSSGKLESTRLTRIKTAVSMLSGGKKRVCCFGGLTWLRKDHKTAGENWVLL